MADSKRADRSGRCPAPPGRGHRRGGRRGAGGAGAGRRPTRWSSTISPRSCGPPRSELAPGWLGAPLDAQSATTPLGGAYPPQFVRLGIAQPLDDARFPAIVPLLGTGHLTVDADARDPRVAGLLRCLLLRLLAAAPAGSLLVRAVDGDGRRHGLRARSRRWPTPG